MCVSRLVRFSHWQRDGGYNLVLENKFFYTLKNPEENEKDADILNPGKLDGFPEARAVGGRGQLREKWRATLDKQLKLFKSLGLEEPVTNTRTFIFPCGLSKNNSLIHGLIKDIWWPLWGIGSWHSVRRENQPLVLSSTLALDTTRLWSLWTWDMCWHDIDIVPIHIHTKILKNVHVFCESRYKIHPSWLQIN